MKKNFDTIISKVCIIIVATLITFLILDAVSIPFLRHRRSSIEQRFPEGSIRKPHPYIMFVGDKNDELFNALGYLGPLPANPKPNNEYRVIVLGGSTIVNGNPRLTTVLEKEFKKDGYQNVEIYNFGVVSSNSAMELSRLIFQAVEFEPDLVVMYNGLNDIYLPYRWDPRPGYPFNFVVFENNPLLESDVREYPAGALLLYSSNILRYLVPEYFQKKFVAIHKLRDDVQYGSLQWNEKIARIYVRNLVKAQKISNAFDTEFIAFFQPALYYKKKITEEERPYVDTGEEKHFVQLRQLIRAHIQKTLKKSKMKIFDLSDVYSNVQTTVYTDEGGHTNQESKVRMAQEMMKHIVQNFEIKK